MRIRLYVDTMACVGETFDQHKDFYDDKNYTDVLHHEAKVSGNIVDAGMHGYGDTSKFSNVALNLFEKSAMPDDFRRMKEKIEFYKADAKIYGEDGKEVDVDKLIRLYADREPFLLYVEFPEDGDDDDYEFLSLMKEWYYTFKRFGEFKDMSDEERMKRTGKMGFGVEFTNLAGNTINGRFEGCTLLGMDENGRLAIVVVKFDIYN